jgi:RNA polymerase sigma-54 factor
MIGQYLIDMVDEAGYLTGDLVSVAEKLGAPLTEVAAVLAILQTLDPPGVCARNLTECLSIQLQERDRFDPAMRMLVEHLELLAKRDFAGLRRLCGVNEEDLAACSIPSRASPSARPWCSRSCRMCWCAPGRTAPGRLN